MARINVYSVDEYDGKTLEGWFDPDRSERFDQDTRWDGNNHVGVITGSQFIDEYLYRTPGGRWVLNHDAHRYCNGPDTYRFLADTEARDWLLRSERNDEAVEKYFGEVAEESGPGRPEIGKPINVRLGDELLARVDAEAARRDTSRADTIRDLIAQALA